MSEFVKETSEYVEMSDSITLCIVKDGAAGSDAVTYGVQVIPYHEWLSGGNTDPGIQIQFTRTTGATVETFTNVTKLGGLAQVYVDGVYHASATDYINRGNDKIVFSHFTIDNTSTGKRLGTASTIGIELLVNSTVVATASYVNGKQGADGKGALEIICDPETIVLDTDDNGLVTDYTNAWAALMCLRDGKEVSGVTYKIGKTANCSATVNDNGTVTITSVTAQQVTIDGNTVSVSSTSGSVTVSVTETATGVTYTKTVPFTVNVARYMGGLKWDKKKLESTYNYLTNNGTSTDFTQFESKIRQTAKEISLKVSEKSVGRRNMLVGSACRKYGDGFTYMTRQYYDGYPTEQIEINSGIDGVNCIHCRTKKYGTDSYYSSGFRWNGISPQGNIKLERGKNYVLSFYAKTHTPNDIIFVAEVIYQGSNIDTSRPDGYNGPTGYCTIFSASETDKWELFTVKVSVPSDAPYEYVEIYIFARATGYSFVDGYICKPMLEEGEEYNGWTLSEQDYDYVGGNLLDGTGTLTKMGNVEVLNGTVTQGGYNNERASVEATLSPTAANNDFLKYSTTGMGLKAGEDCMLSFYARSSGKGILQCYLYPSTGGIFTESSHEKIDGVWNPSDGDLRTPIAPTREWKRYWVHWRPSVNDPQHVLFRLLRPGTDKGSYNSSTSYNVGDVVLYGGTYYVCKKAGSGYRPGAPGSSIYWEASWFSIEIARPKLEVGATMTEWTEKRADMVDKHALLATGIDIDSKKITLTADKTVFRTNSGKEIAVFSGDGINADLIHARALSTTGTNGHGVVIEDAMARFFGNNGVANIVFGVNSDGFAVLRYYDNKGKFLYDLGPTGITANDVRESSINTVEGISANVIAGMKGYTFETSSNNGWLHCVPTDYEYLIFGGISDDRSAVYYTEGYTPTKLAGSQTLYQYHAAYTSGAPVRDPTHGLDTADLAKAADGKYFTSETMGANGALTNLANGSWFLGSYKTWKVTDDSGVNHPYMAIVYAEFKDGFKSTKTLYTYELSSEVK